ncbi:unnamed protein product [Arctogadus glacialis]
MWANMLPKVRPSLQLLCHLITNYTPLLHDNDVGRRRATNGPTKPSTTTATGGTNVATTGGARISEGHHGRQGHRGNRGDRRRKSRQWHRSNRKYPRPRQAPGAPCSAPATGAPRRRQQQPPGTPRQRQQPPPGTPRQRQQHSPGRPRQRQTPAPPRARAQPPEGPRQRQTPGETHRRSMMPTKTGKLRVFRKRKETPFCGVRQSLWPQK